jgi:hypothetical protein
MTTIGPDPGDADAIASLLDEVHAAETAWHDGELPPLTRTDRVALRAARLLLLRSRHAREHAAVVTEGADVATAHTFEHRYDGGPLR